MGIKRSNYHDQVETMSPEDLILEDSLVEKMAYSHGFFLHLWLGQRLMQAVIKVNALDKKSNQNSNDVGVAHENCNRKYRCERKTWNAVCPRPGISKNGNGSNPVIWVYEFKKDGKREVEKLLFVCLDMSSRMLLCFNIQTRGQILFGLHLCCL